MHSIPQTDPCSEIISRIAAYGDSTIPVPALSRLLGVKSTTLNARFRRQQITLRTIGRTSYLPYEQARQLVELHRYALMGWPTLLAASKITDIKPGTLKARCEKGQLEGHVDLTKRLRLNPAELSSLRTPASPAEASLKAARLGTWTQRAGSKRAVKRLGSNGSSDAVPFAQAKDSTNARIPGAAGGMLFARVNFTLGPAPEPKIAVLGPKDYGLPETANAPQVPGRRHPISPPAKSSPSILVYDPMRPFSLSVCAPGKVVRYGEYTGTILKLIDDPYNPRIKVSFPEHPQPVMKEVLLAVEKKKVQLG